MQKKQSSFWGLSFKPALALQLSHSQQLLKVTASSQRGVTQRFFRLFPLPRKLPTHSLLKQLGKFSPPGITQMLRNWQLLQGKICFLKQNLDEKYFLFTKEHIFLLCSTIFQDSDYAGNVIMICFALSKWDEILQEETILSVANTIRCRGVKSWSAFLTITILLKQNICWNGLIFFYI